MWIVAHSWFPYSVWSTSAQQCILVSVQNQRLEAAPGQNVHQIPVAWQTCYHGIAVSAGTFCSSLRKDKALVLKSICEKAIWLDLTILATSSQPLPSDVWGQFMGYSDSRARSFGFLKAWGARDKGSLSKRQGLGSQNASVQYDCRQTKLLFRLNITGSEADSALHNIIISNIIITIISNIIQGDGIVEMS